MDQSKSMLNAIKVIPKDDSGGKSPLEGQTTVPQAFKNTRLIYDLYNNRHKCISDML